MSRTSNSSAGDQGTAKAATEKVKPAAKRTAKLSREQRQHLQQRISVACRILRASANSLSDIKKPTAVKQAEKVVFAWERRQEFVRRTRIGIVNNKEVRVNETLLFQTPEEALKAVIFLEKEAGKVK